MAQLIWLGALYMLLIDFKSTFIILVIGKPNNKLFYEVKRCTN